MSELGHPTKNPGDFTVSAQAVRKALAARGEFLRQSQDNLQCTVRVAKTHKDAADLMDTTCKLCIEELAWAAYLEDRAGEKFSYVIDIVNWHIIGLIRQVGSHQ